MLDVCLLGTGGMMPLPRRWLTACMMRYNGSNLLIDCGEGTQIAIREKGWTVKPLDIICLTHFHADHVSGLPGLLLCMSNAERTEPLTIIGPKGVERVVNSLRVIAPELPFPIEFIEITEPERTIRLKGYRIEAFRVQHNITCYGYSVCIDRAGRFDADRAKALGIPLKFWNPLQKGQTMTDGDTVYTPDMVMGRARRGLKVTYTTDTRPVPVIARMAEGADLFICEGMYGEPEKAEKAKEHKHMTMEEAAKLARAAQPKEMWLTHYSPSLLKPSLFLPDAKKIFPNTVEGKDGMSVELMFEDEEADEKTEG